MNISTAVACLNHKSYIYSQNLVTLVVHSLSFSLNHSLSLSLSLSLGVGLSSRV